MAGEAGLIRRVKPASPLPAAVWVAIVLGAIPLSWLIATLGVMIAVVSPARDVAMLVLWSTSEEMISTGALAVPRTDMLMRPLSELVPACTTSVSPGCSDSTAVSKLDPGMRSIVRPPD